LRLFHRVNERFVAHLGPEERAVLVGVVEAVQAMIQGEATPGFDTIPTLARLFPPGSTTDREIAREFAELTGEAMRTNKTKRLESLARNLARGKIELDREEAGETVAALNDVRLAVAEILGIETAEDAARIDAGRTDGPAGGPEGLEDVLVELYVVLTVLQESLVQALSAVSPSH
jgi:hypothetical protein